MFKNVASQKLVVFAFDSTTNLPKSGDSANITAYVNKDWAGVTVLTDTSATELDSTNAKGYYIFDLSQSETNGDTLHFTAKSSTSNIVVIGVPATVFTYPTTGILAPATSGRTLVVDAAGLADANMVKLGPSGSGTAQTAKDLGSINVTNLNTLSGHDPGATLGTSTLTQTQVTGGAYALNSASFSFNAALDLTTTQKASVNTEADTAASDYGALKPTTAGRTLDVSATGEGGVDWANVGGQSTTVNLSATTVNLTNTATTLTNDPSGVTTLLSRIPSGIFTGITSLAQWLGLIAGKQTGNSTARTEIRATGAGSGTFDETTDSQEAIRDRGDAAWTTATGFSTHSASDVWAVGTRVLTAGTNIVLAKGTGVTGFNDLDAAGVRSAVGLASANLDTQIDALPTAAENFAAVLTTQMTEAYAADGTAPTLAQAVFLIQQSLHEFAISGTTRTVKKLDGSTSAATFTLDSATAPTSTTRAT